MSAFTRLAELHAELARAYADLAQQEPAPGPPPEPDRAVGIEEACRLLGMTRAYLERKSNWAQLGGYKDDDGRVKFPLTSLQRHVQRQGRR